MITESNKLRIARGNVYLANFGTQRQELYIIDILKDPEDSSVKHQYGWESVKDFMKRSPKFMGHTRKILGIRCGVIRSKSPA